MPYKKKNTDRAQYETLNGKKLFIETYGCQMNVADSEIVASILSGEGYTLTDDYRQADLILVNTCSVREKAEQTVRNKLANFTHLKRARPWLLIGVLGCMAERLKEKLLDEEKMVDLGSQGRTPIAACPCSYARHGITRQRSTSYYPLRKHTAIYRRCVCPATA